MKELGTKNKRTLERSVRIYAEDIVLQNQIAMVQEFESHPVTIEIASGPEAENLSGLLGGYGNLFSFIGFEKGTDPTEIIADKLRQKIPVVARMTNASGIFEIKINSPTKQSLDKIAKIPWLKGRGWLDGIENGLAGLGQYLYDEGGFDKSLSGTGLQVKKRVSGVKMAKSKYISEILNNFRKNIIKNK
jgi:hypothetical protein